MKKKKSRNSISSLVISEHVSRRERGFEKIRHFIETEYNLNLKARTRKREYSDARCMFFYIARTYLRSSYDAMASYLNRDHSTALHHLKNVHPSLYMYDRVYRDTLNKFEALEILTKADSPIFDKEESLLSVNFRLSSLNESLSNEISELKAEIRRLKSFSTEKKHILDLIYQVPEEKTEALQTRLEPMVRMLLLAKNL